MMTMFETQDNWPLPPVNRAPKNPRRKWQLETMKVGSMFFLPNRAVKSVSAYVSRITRTMTGRWTARACYGVERRGAWHEAQPGDKGAVAGVGVWRIE